MEKFHPIWKKEEMTYKQNTKWYNPWFFKKKNKIIIKCKKY